MQDAIQPIKRGRGRPAGSNSFERIRIQDLLNILGVDGNSQMVIPVSTVWLREQNVSVVSPSSVSVAAAKEEEIPAAPIEFSITPADDDED